MNPCPSCPILCSCTRKHDHPKTCTHRPAQIGTNLSNGFANLAQHRIAIVETAMPKPEIVRELRLRIEVCGECQ